MESKQSFKIVADGLCGFSLYFYRHKLYNCHNLNRPYQYTFVELYIFEITLVYFHCSTPVCMVRLRIPSSARERNMLTKWLDVFSIFLSTLYVDLCSRRYLSTVATCYSFDKNTIQVLFKSSGYEILPYC